MITPEQRERFTDEHLKWWSETSRGIVGSSVFRISEAAWIAARELSESSPYPCQACGAETITITEPDSVTLKCVACGWTPVEIVVAGSINTLSNFN